MATLREQSDEAMLNIYRRAKSEANFTARVYLDMVVAPGGLAAAKLLINAGKPSPVTRTCMKGGGQQPRQG